MDPLPTLTYKIKGSGIRGFDHTKDDWDAKRNSILEVKTDERKCLRVYTDEGVNAGSIATELQEDLKTFLASKPSSIITVKVISLKALFKVQGKGKELPCDIFLSGEDTPAVRNAIRGLQEVIKKLKKKDGMDLSIAKQPTKRKKKTDNETSEENAASGDAANETLDEIAPSDGEDDGRPEATSAAGDADKDSKVTPAENATEDENNADKDENTDNSSKRKMSSDADSLSNEPSPKVIKETEASTSAAQPQLGCGDEKILIFRYQYLLIEIGTEVLKALFDKLVGSDIMAYLDANPTKFEKLELLMSKKMRVITKPQQELLPPKDNKPSSSNFDITLLCCLLTNICDLPSGDSLEADIATLRTCRNYVSHKRTVFISKTDFNSKWTELKEILERLNTNGKCGIADLKSTIADANKIPIDEKRKDDYYAMLKLWGEMDKALGHGIGNVQKTVDGIKEDVFYIKNYQAEMKKDVSVIKTDQAEMKEDVSDMRESLTDVKDGQARMTKHMAEMDEKMNQLAKK